MGFLGMRDGEPASHLSLLLARHGDVESNPGPKWPCRHCGKGVGYAGWAIQCSGCKEWIHGRCVEKGEVNKRTCRIDHVWKCRWCRGTEGGEVRVRDGDGVARGTTKEGNGREMCKICKKGIVGEIKQRCEKCEAPVHKSCTGGTRWARENRERWCCDGCEEGENQRLGESGREERDRNQQKLEEVREGRECRKCRKKMKEARILVKCRCCEWLMHQRCSGVMRGQLEGDGRLGRWTCEY